MRTARKTVQSQLNPQPCRWPQPSMRHLTAIRDKFPVPARHTVQTRNRTTSLQPHSPRLRLAGPRRHRAASCLRVSHCRPRPSQSDGNQIRARIALSVQEAVIDGQSRLAQLTPNPAGGWLNLWEAFQLVKRRAEGLRRRGGQDLASSSRPPFSPSPRPRQLSAKSTPQPVAKPADKHPQPSD